MTKWLALVLMVVDHLAIILYEVIPEEIYTTMRVIGRISYPLFIYFVVLGVQRTSNINSYMRNLIVFAIVAETVRAQFDVLKIEELNVMFGFFIFAFMYHIFKKEASIFFKIFVVSVLVYLIQFVEYGYFGLALFVLIYIVNGLEIKGEYKSLMVAVIIPIISYFTYDSSVQMFSLIAAFFMFNSKLEKRLLNKQIEKWVFYVFYPLQFAILGIIYTLFLK